MYLLYSSLISIFSSSSAEPLVPDSFTMPLYPVLLSVFTVLFGSLRFFPFLQMIFAGLSAFLIFLLGKKFFSEKVGLFAAMLFILDPTVIFHSLIIMTDITYVFLLVLSIWLLFATRAKNAYVGNFAAGIFLGLSMLTRVVSMFLIFLIIPMYFFAKMRETGWRKTLLQILVIVFAYSLVLVPWVIRNKEVSGVWGIASEKSANLFHYYVPDFLSFRDGISVDTARDILIADFGKKIGTAQAQDFGSLANSSAAQEVALRYIENDPFGYAKFHLIKTAPFFLSSGIKNFFVSYNDMLGFIALPTNGGNMTDLLFHGKFRQFAREIQVQPFVTLEEIYWAIVFVSMLISVVFSKNKFYAISFFILVLYFALLTGSIAYSRFRLPALPFMLILACEGFLLFKNKLTHSIIRI